MEEIYYVDRPSVPATQQNIIHLDAVVEHSIFIDSVDIRTGFGARAVEVRNSGEEIDGTLLYFPGVTFEGLMTAPITKEVEADLSEVFDGEEVGVNELIDTPQTLDEFNRESELIDLELALAEATQAVQEIEEQIAAIEKEAFID